MAKAEGNPFSGGVGPRRWGTGRRPGAAVGGAGDRAGGISCPHRLAPTGPKRCCRWRPSSARMSPSPYSMPWPASPTRDSSRASSASRPLSSSRRAWFPTGCTPSGTSSSRGWRISRCTHARQQLHQRQHTRWPTFSSIINSQPELVAQHYTEADSTEQAIVYWQRAGQRALQQSANPEAIRRLTRGLDLLAMLPKTPERAQQELDLHLALGPALMATRGQAAPEVEQTYARARALCAQLGETPQLFPTLRGLCRFYQTRGPLLTARELGTARPTGTGCVLANPSRLEAHNAFGSTFLLGEYPRPGHTSSRGSPSLDPAAERTPALRHGVAPGCSCLGHDGAHAVVPGLSSAGPAAESGGAGPSSGAGPSPESGGRPGLRRPPCITAAVRYRRSRRRPRPPDPGENRQGFPLLGGAGTCWQGWALALQGHERQAWHSSHQGLAAVLATGQTMTRPTISSCSPRRRGTPARLRRGCACWRGADGVLRPVGGATCWRSHRLQGEFLLRQAIQIQPRRKPVSSRPSLWPAVSRPNPGSCGQPSA